MHIDAYKFGSIQIDGQVYAEDLFVVRGRVHPGWWRRAGGHVFAPEDLDPVIAAAPEIVCLGTGDSGRVTVSEETMAAFRSAGSRVIVDRTPRVVEELNRLWAEGRDAAAALHLTC